MSRCGELPSSPEHLPPAAGSLTLTALPVLQGPVPAGASTAVGTGRVHTGVHAEPGACLLPVELTFIHIWGQKCPA